MAHRKIVLLFLSVLTLCPPGLHRLNAQFESGFDVVSVKRGEAKPGGFQLHPGGTFVANNVSLRMLIEKAYAIPFFQIARLPAWALTDPYVIEGKLDRGPVNLSPDDLQQLLQHLLKERFKLRAHREIAEGSTLALVVGKKGAHLDLPKEGDVENAGVQLALQMRPGSAPLTTGGTLYGTRSSLSTLVRLLTGILKRPITDRTGLKGDYNFMVQYALEGSSVDGPSIAQACEEQLGLVLRNEKGPIESLIVDSVARPSEN